MSSTGRGFVAPLAAGAVVALAVLGLVLYSVANPRPKLTVDDLNPPVVAAVRGGQAIYAANSAEAVTEDVKFGYLPAVDLAALSDGTVVVADPDDASASGLDGDLSKTDAKTFAEATIPAPTSTASADGTASAKDTDVKEVAHDPGTTQTWEELVDEHGDDTVLMPSTEDPEVAQGALDTLAENGRTEGAILCSGNPEVLAAGKQAGVATLYTGDLDGADPSSVAELGATMVAVPHDAADLDTWTASDLAVWATGVETSAELTQLGDAGVFGAFADNPFAIQPSAVKKN